ncbi:MAG TPA: type II toxin-antitoxin system CcdA family antitoxin [Mycobacteriales bacterium]|nr:type II toxin-antitoxin system CcdA family antitoxin [Mycobacteriales bacterium]
MARVNITIPDDLVANAKAADLNISKLATEAVADALDRLSKIRALDDYLAELDEELGPPSTEDIAEAQEWVKRLRQGAGTRTS